jgi:hypothetical protein
MNTSFGTPRLAKLFLAIMYMFMPLAVQTVAAQDATPDAMSGTACTTILGVGAEGDACVNVVHAVPDAPAVDIALAGGAVLVSDLAFGPASDYLEVPAGTYDLEVRVAGTMDVALPLPAVALEDDMLYDVIAVATVADGTLTVIVIPSMTSHGE